MARFASPGLPKGRGLAMGDFLNTSVGHSETLPNDCVDTGIGQSPGCTPISRVVGVDPQTSTPHAQSDADAINHLTEMVGQLGTQIGDSIVARLMSAGVVNMNSHSQTTSPTQATHRDVSRHDIPHVTVHVKSDKDLQIFRGDHTDKFSVREWIDMTKTHLRKHEIPVCEQGEEIMSHLMGKARDVVRVALRSDPTLDTKKEPELIYDVLLHYFSEAPSCLPLADFYATLPKHKENSVDYWIRLNKAADLALEGLRKQGKQSEDMTNEVALMFVKFCPDPELSCTLKCKPLHEWTSRDVQLRIDDYQRELRAKDRNTSTALLKSHFTAVTAEQPSSPSSSLAVSEQCLTSSPSSFSLQTQHDVHNQFCTSAPPVSVQGQAAFPVVAQNVQQSEDRLLTRMVDMFQEMMGRMQQRSASRPGRGGRYQRGPRHERPNGPGCKVCNDLNHTTDSHCRSDWLCFSCFAPGHIKSNCPANNSSKPQSEGN